MDRRKRDHCVFNLGYTALESVPSAANGDELLLIKFTVEVALNEQFQQPVWFRSFRGVSFSVSAGWKKRVLDVIGLE